MKAFYARKPVYNTWQHMIRRCVDPTFKDWHIYGGRPGNPVTVCERWYDYAAFAADMGARPSMDHTIDRIDGTKGYEPGNCKWSTATEQARNTTRNIFFEHDGLNLTLGEWCERSGINYLTLYTRITEGGMSFADAIQTPVGMPKSVKGRINSKSHMIIFNGETMPLVAWAERLNAPYKNLASRIRRGMDFATAFTQPYERQKKPKGTFKTSVRMITFRGEAKTIIAWAETLGLPYHALRSRILRGMNPALALTKPFRKSVVRSPTLPLPTSP